MFRVEFPAPFQMLYLKTHTNSNTPTNVHNYIASTTAGSYQNWKSSCVRLQKDHLLTMLNDVICVLGCLERLGCEGCRWIASLNVGLFSMATNEA